MAMMTKLNEMKRSEAKRNETQHHNTIQTMALLKCRIVVCVCVCMQRLRTAFEYAVECYCYRRHLRRHVVSATCSLTFLKVLQCLKSERVDLRKLKNNNNK